MYFYFIFSDETKHGVGGLRRSLITQVVASRKTMPEQVKHIYNLGGYCKFSQSSSDANIYIYKNYCTLLILPRNARWTLFTNAPFPGDAECSRHPPVPRF